MEIKGREKEEKRRKREEREGRRKGTRNLVPYFTPLS